MKRSSWSVFSVSLAVSYIVTYNSLKVFINISTYFIALAHLAPRSRLKMHCQRLLSWCVDEFVTQFLDCQESVSGPFIWLPEYFGKQKLFICFKRIWLLGTNSHYFVWLYLFFWGKKKKSIPLSFLYLYVRFMVQRIEQKSHAGEYWYFTTSAKAMFYNFLI